MADKYVFQKDHELDWNEVETKVQIISRKFSNIDPKYREDLEQELRLFAFTTSAHYGHMYNRAIDYWRHLSNHVYPEVCVFDVEDGEGNKLCIPEESYEDSVADDTADLLLAATRRELDRYAQTKTEREVVEMCKRILEIIELDIHNLPDPSLKESTTYKYRDGGKYNLTWVMEQTGFPYKRIQWAMDVLKEIMSTVIERKQVIL